MYVFSIGKYPDHSVLCAKLFNFKIFKQQTFLEIVFTKFPEKFNITKFFVSTTFHYQQVQGLLKVQFCQWYLRKVFRDNRFIEKIKIADKATFTRDEAFNGYNSCIWCGKNL